MRPCKDLKPDFRTVFVLRDIEELSTEETAETLGISIPAVKSSSCGRAWRCARS